MSQVNAGSRRNMPGSKPYGKTNRDKGLVVLGVPANDFGAQEPGTEKEIKTFCETRFQVDFPMTAKEHVIGDDAHPLYKWVVSEWGKMRRPNGISTNIFSIMKD